MFFSKKAEGIWISWVLLMAFIVGLSVFMFGWAEERSEVFVQELGVMADTAECDSVGIRVLDICQNSQYLNMNIANRNTISINQLVMNIYDIYLESPISRVINVTISPDNVETLRVLKQSTTQEIEIVPVVFTERDRVFCYRKAVTISNIDYCG